MALGRWHMVVIWWFLADHGGTWGSIVVHGSDSVDGDGNTVILDRRAVATITQWRGVAVCLRKQTVTI